MNKVMLFLSIFLISSCKKNGCTYIISLNYNDKATSDDGSCCYKYLNKESIFYYQC